MNTEHHHRILHIQNGQGTKFQFQQTILMKKNSQKTMLPARNRKNEHNHWILHIRISLSTKFELKVAILIFWTKFTQNGYFRAQTNKKKKNSNSNSAYSNKSLYRILAKSDNFNFGQFSHCPKRVFPT